ncbi:hypothetical protein OZ13_09440 [Xanthomonas cannabis pv. cannabis]|nr:hypothetical protein OZ13_09440 [Xanthomonas cannabis pv. cannabis]KHL57344.1 hypothetical protein OZ10_06800 [Xanthomonas cannabis pv. cannabis]
MREGMALIMRDGMALIMRDGMALIRPSGTFSRQAGEGDDDLPGGRRKRCSAGREEEAMFCHACARMRAFLLACVPSDTWLAPRSRALVSRWMSFSRWREKVPRRGG